MDTGCVNLTVFFEEPFWVGVFEQISGGRLSVCKITFGAEPGNHEVWDLILRHYYELKFSPPVETEVRRIPENPKRRQRNARKLLQAPGIGTKSQQAIQIQREQAKIQRERIHREQREAEKQRQFDLKQQKRREKRRGH